MGIPLLTKLLFHNGSSGIRRIGIEDLANKVLAIDASMSLYTFLTVNNIYTYHLQKTPIPLDGLFFRVLKLLRNNIKPLFVFDGVKNPHKIRTKVKIGQTHPFSEAELIDGYINTLVEKNQQTSELTSDHLLNDQHKATTGDGIPDFSSFALHQDQEMKESSDNQRLETSSPILDPNLKPSFYGKKYKQLTPKQRKEIAEWNVAFTSLRLEHLRKFKEFLSLLGVPFLHARGESEGQCANLNRVGLVDAVVVEDMDAFAYDAKTVIRGLMRTYPHKQKLHQFDTSAILNEIGLNITEFRDLCIILGCDYTPRIPAIGMNKALNLIKKHKSIENILAHLRKTNSLLIKEEELESLEKSHKIAREEFESPSIIDDICEFSWSAPQYANLLDFMIEHGCKEQASRRRVEELMDIKDPCFTRRVWGC